MTDNYTENGKRKNPDLYEIDIKGILYKIKYNKKLLVRTAVMGAVAGICIAFSIPRLFTTTVTLSPEVGSSDNTRALGGLASSFLGASLSGSNNDALNASLSSDIVYSTPFLLELLDSEIITGEGDSTISVSDYLDMQKASLPGMILGAPLKLMGLAKSALSGNSEEKDMENGTNNKLGKTIILNKKEARKIKLLKSAILIEIAKKTGITYVNVTLQDPVASAIVADSVVSKLQKYIISYRTSKAKEDCNYLESLYEMRKAEYYDAQKKYARFMDNNTNMIFQSTLLEQERLQNEVSLAYQVYTQVSQQLQMARAKVQEVKPVFAVVEPAVIPLEASNMSRKTVALACMILITGATFVWVVFLKDKFKRLKEIINATGRQ